MASQKELVAVVAKVMGVAIETVTVIDRYLAEAGLRTRAKRGRGETAMTYEDAANLIIATAWEANPKDAVHLVNTFRSLPAERVKETASVSADALGATFAEALAHALEQVPRHLKEFSVDDDDPRHMSFDITMYRSSFADEADICFTKGGRRNTFEFRRPFDRTKRSVEVRDLRRTAEFSQITLGFVGSAIAEGFAK